ncbi:MAG: hypothetical protein BAJATHORv1_30266 [Candidatus Thorarchaeota archaeon]|nr:MAG: hypothetical protein BAJATHORv1_30266 [Candidatus Thorarchaeota archaeon]
MEFSADMTGKVCLVTGSNSGIGKATTKGLASMDAKLIMVVRDRQKGEAARSEIIEETGNSDIDILVADLSEMDEVRELAKQVRGKYERLDVLINNAGAIFGERRETSDGYEMTIALNHFAPLLLTYELLPLLSQSSPARVVNVSSGAHSFGEINLDDPFYDKDYSSMEAYGTAKLMMIMTTKELAEKIENYGITINSLHPGFVRTNFGRKNMGLGARFFFKLTSPFQKSPEEGAETPLFLATSPEVKDVTGKYFANKEEKKPDDEAQDSGLREKIWNFSNNTLNLDWDEKLNNISVTA